LPDELATRVGCERANGRAPTSSSETKTTLFWTPFGTPKGSSLSQKRSVWLKLKLQTRGALQTVQTVQKVTLAEWFKKFQKGRFHLCLKSQKKESGQQVAGATGDSVWCSSFHIEKKVVHLCNFLLERRRFEVRALTDSRPNGLAKRVSRLQEDSPTWR